MDDSSWKEEIDPGRAARLSLRGPNGALDIYVCYLPTGSEHEDQKQHVIRRLRESLAPNNSVLSILMGDWNFVMQDEDRICLRSMQFTGGSDRAIARSFQSLLDEHHLHELEQLAFTHENSTAQSKIDRIYSTGNSAHLLYLGPDSPRTSQSLSQGNPGYHSLTTKRELNFLRTSYNTNIGSATYI